MQTAQLTRSNSQTFHFICSHGPLVLWQRDHYVYEIENRRTNELLATPKSFKSATVAFETIVYDYENAQKC